MTPRHEWEAARKIALEDERCQRRIECALGCDTRHAVRLLTLAALRPLHAGDCVPWHLAQAAILRRSGCTISWCRDRVYGARTTAECYPPIPLPR